MIKICDNIVNLISICRKITNALILINYYVYGQCDMKFILYLLIKLAQNVCN